jgi:hypothetical protein
MRASFALLPLRPFWANSMHLEDTEVRDGEEEGVSDGEKEGVRDFVVKNC